MNIQKRTYQPTNQTNRKNNKHNQISKQATRHNVAKQNRTQNQQEATSNNSFLLRFTVFAHLRKHKGAMCGGHRKLLRISAESNIPKMKLFVGISILQLRQKGSSELKQVDPRTKRWHILARHKLHHFLPPTKLFCSGSEIIPKRSGAVPTLHRFFLACLQNRDSEAPSTAVPKF